MLTDENVRYHVGNLLVKLGTDLSEQIMHCICTGHRCPDCRTATLCNDMRTCATEAEHMTTQFFARVPEVRRLLRWTPRRPMTATRPPRASRRSSTAIRASTP